MVRSGKVSRYGKGQETARPSILANDEATGKRPYGIAATHVDCFAFRKATMPFKGLVRG